MLAILLLHLGLLASAPAMPTLAEEDTIALASGVLPEVVVRAPRITLDEILRRVDEGETVRDIRISDQSFTATFRLMKDVTQGKPQLVQEQVTRVYKKKPDMVREVPLRQWPREKGGPVEIGFSPSTGERIMSFAFAASQRDRFRFRIVDRSIVGGHVIYRVSYEPRSPLAVFAPRGTVWIDTNEFIIIRQEVRFPRSPVPLVLKSIDRMVVERVATPDGHWVMSRMLLRAQSTVPLPKLGRSFDMALLLGDYQINQGILDSFFDAPGGRHVRVMREDD